MERRFTVQVRTDKDGLWAEVNELPGCFASGKTMPELLDALGEAIGFYLSEEGEPVRVQDVQYEPPAGAQKKLPILARLSPAA